MRHISEEYLRLLREAYECSGETLRSLSRQTGLHYTTIHLIINGKRMPSRNALIKLCGWGLTFTVPEMDRILELVDYAPLSDRSEGSHGDGSQIRLSQRE